MLFMPLADIGGSTSNISQVTHLQDHPWLTCIKCILVHIVAIQWSLYCAAYLRFYQQNSISVVFKEWVQVGSGLV